MPDENRLAIVTQQRHEKMCGQCVLATILGMKVERVCELLGIQKGKRGPHARGTDKRDLVHFLETRGWECGKTIRTDSRDCGIQHDDLVGAHFGMPENHYCYAIVKSTIRHKYAMRTTPSTHWMLWWAMDPTGLYCPDRGRMQVKSFIDSAAPNQRERITSYFIVTPRRGDPPNEHGSNQTRQRTDQHDRQAGQGD